MRMSILDGRFRTQLAVVRRPSFGTPPCLAGFSCARADWICIVARSPCQQLRDSQTGLSPTRDAFCNVSPSTDLILVGGDHYSSRVYYIIFVGRSLKASASGGEFLESYLIFTLFRPFFEIWFIHNYLKFCLSETLVITFKLLF
jgi:hypothetical protein